MWSEQQQDDNTVVSGNPNYNNTSAAALLAYDVPHSIPWDWRVSLYTWTKGIAAGAYLVAADRKSTRLNSSHLVISFAVFSFKKKIQSLLLLYHSSIRTHVHTHH